MSVDQEEERYQELRERFDDLASIVDAERGKGGLSDRPNVIVYSLLSQWLISQIFGPNFKRSLVQ
jgi:hypothetical protein